MASYILRRLLLMIPTILGIMVLNFVIVQAAPGGPVERLVAQLTGQDFGATATISGGGAETTVSNDAQARSRAEKGLDPALLKEIEQLYGFDKSPAERFFIMMGQYLTFDFGSSFYSDREVVDLVLDKLPVSISLGLWTTLLVYFISIPLGIRKAVRDGSQFDLVSSFIVIVGYAIPNFLFAVLLVILFAGGTFLDWFPLRGLTSEGFADMSTFQQVLDYLWHITLPVLSMVISGFASLTMLTKNSFLDEIGKQYVLTARSKGVTEGRVLYGHVFRNAMLIVIAGFPSAFLSIFFTGAMLIEVIFSLDGLGLLGFESVVNRDYPVVFATLYVFSLLGMFMGLISDLTYRLIDPRIDFDRRDVT